MVFNNFFHLLSYACHIYVYIIVDISPLMFKIYHRAWLCEFVNEKMETKMEVADWRFSALHDDAFTFLRPWIVLFVRGVDQGIVFLVLLHIFSHAEKINELIISLQRSGGTRTLFERHHFNKTLIWLDLLVRTNLEMGEQFNVAIWIQYINWKYSSRGSFLRCKRALRSKERL